VTAANDDKSAPLHVFRNEANEWFVATSAEDAFALRTVHIGALDEWEEPEDYEFSQWPDEKVLSVRDEDEPEAEKHTGAEWAAKNGRGFFFAGEP
jgi:hypothetical protein